ncbi:Uncharacterised protein [Enterococcus faecium]|uniref:Uncharacterized protein n=1 Tax=Enterococcus faecium TaxID=1352 RepID=A0A6N3E7M8_ENTFC|nr:hypothetical protein [Enterococcus sp. T0168A.B-11]TXU25093.1 hypothetical protein D4M94_13285 [Enterococcus sp. T0168A.B-11]
MGKLVSLFKNNKFQSFLCGVLGGFIVFIVFGIDFSLSGSLAEWLSALGTIGAVWVSLWIVFDEKKVNVLIIVDKTREQNKSESTIIGGKFKYVEAYAHNYGTRPIAILFLGFRPQGADKDDYIKRLDDLLDNPEIEFIPPGNLGKKHQEDIEYLLSAGQRYVNEDKSLHLEAVFIDIQGKEYLKDIIITSTL